MVTNTQRIKAHNDELRECIELAESLPDADSGGTANPIIEPLAITENGTYTPPDGVDGYSPVSVNVPIPDGYIVPSGTKTITENGTHDAKAYASVNVNVPTGGGAEDRLDDFLSNTLTSIDSDATNIVSYGIYGRTALKTVSLPKCTNISSYAFRGCSGITNVDAPLVTNIATYAFYGCSKLADINMSMATAIGSYAFYACDLRSVNFPSVTGISQGAFSENENLQLADFGSAYNMKQAALGDCSKLDTLILRRKSDPCTLAATSLGNTPIEDGTGYVYVPIVLLSDDDATKDYRRATNWAKYAAQFRPLVATVADLAGIDVTVYDRAWVDEDYCVYLYNGSGWEKET